MSNLNKLYKSYDEAKKLARQDVADYIYKATEFQRVAIGEEIVRLRASMTMDQIALSMGRVGKAFLYDCVKAYEATVDPEPEGTEEMPEITYEIEKFAGGDGFVWIRNPNDPKNEDGQREYYLGRDNNGDLIVPDEWATHSPELRAVYKQVIAEIEG